MNHLNETSLFELKRRLARFKWPLAGLGVVAISALGFVMAQGNAPVPNGGSLSLGAQVVGPANSGTLNSSHSVSSNDQLQFTAQISQPTTTPSNRDGLMTFPPNFTWLSGSVLAPPNVENKRWNTGTLAAPVWVTTEPAAGTAVSQFAWTEKPAITLDLKPTTAPAVDFKGTGDGYRIFTYKNTDPAFAKDHLYVINHHAESQYLNCRDALTAKACPGFEKNPIDTKDTGGLDVSSEKGVALGKKLNTNLFTTNRNIEHLNPATGEVFFYVGDAEKNVRVLCANLNTLQSCATGKILGVSRAAKFEAVNPIGSIGNKFYALADNSKIYCYDVILKDMCSTSYPANGEYVDAGVSSVSMNLVMGTRLLYITNNKITCFDTLTEKPCSETGWKTGGTVFGDNALFPVLNVDGTPKGACTRSGCKTLKGEYFTILSQSTAYNDFFYNNQMFTGNRQFALIGAYTQVNFYGTKVFHTTSIDTANIVNSIDLKNFASCFDFATDAPCPGFPINHPTDEVRVYSITKDTVRANCMWSIGDPSLARSFDPRNGGPCVGEGGVPPEIVMTVDPKLNVQCDGSATAIRSWKALRFSPTMRWGGDYLSALNVEISDSNGNPIAPEPNRSFAPNTFELNLDNIPYQTYPKLTFKLKPIVGKANFLTTVGFDVTWDGDPTQVCVKVKAPVLSNCSPITASADTAAVPSHSTNDTPDRLHADQSGTAGVIQTGLGPVANSTTLLQQAKGGSDPTQVLQTRFDMGGYKGDLFQYELLSINNLSTLPISKASSESPVNRKYFTSNGAANGQPSVMSLAWANLTLDQKAALNLNKAGLADTLGPDRVAYVTGNRSKEKSDAGGVFRARTDTLGPVINSSPAILQNSILAGLSNSKFPNYSNFKRTVSRTDKLVFYNGNDNLLHAYKVKPTGLTQAFSYMPSMALKEVPRLTDSTLSEIIANPYFMDNTPMVADVNVAATATGDDWRSVVVSNRGRGGRGVFALDVTGDKTKSNANQNRPDSVLFEYSHTTASAAGEDSLADLGYNLGQPPSNKVTGADQIVRVRHGASGSDSRWAYITGNGVEGSVGKDGKACNLTNAPCSQKAVLYLFYLNGNLSTGARWKRIAVHADATTASGLDLELDFGNGLSTPRPADVDGDGVVDYVYAGDLKGNVWRFDLTNMANVVVTKIFKTEGAQPIHTAPALVSATGNGTCSAAAGSARACMMVVVGTGQYTNPIKPLLTSAVLQRLYGIFDKTDLTGSSALVPTDKLTQQTISTNTVPGSNGLTYRTVSSLPVDYVNGQRGWKIDLPSYEHNTANPVMQANGTVLFASTQPSSAAPTCSDGWLTQVNANTGSGALPFAIGGAGASVKLPNSLDGVGSYSVPSSLGGGSLNSTQSSLITSTLKGPTGNTFANLRELILGRMSWREVFGAPKN